jgi:acetyl-CoA synthetase
MRMSPVEHAAKDGQKVEKVLVWQRYSGKYSAKTPMVDGRDFFVNDLLKKYTVPGLSRNG